MAKIYVSATHSLTGAASTAALLFSNGRALCAAIAARDSIQQPTTVALPAGINQNSAPGVIFSGAAVPDFSICNQAGQPQVFNIEQFSTFASFSATANNGLDAEGQTIPSFMFHNTPLQLPYAMFFSGAGLATFRNINSLPATPTFTPNLPSFAVSSLNNNISTGGGTDNVTGINFKADCTPLQGETAANASTISSAAPFTVGVYAGWGATLSYSAPLTPGFYFRFHACNDGSPQSLTSTVAQAGNNLVAWSTRLAAAGQAICSETALSGGLVTITTLQNVTYNTATFKLFSSWKISALPFNTQTY